MCPIQFAEGACNNDYTILTNTNAYGGSGQTGIGSVDGCKSACNANANCYGFDFDRTAGKTVRCFLHLSQITSTNAASGVDQYRIIRTCTGPGSGSGSNAPGSFTLFYID